MVNYKLKQTADKLIQHLSNIDKHQLEGNEYALLHRLNDAIRLLKGDNGDVVIPLEYIKSILNRTWEHLNTGKWDSVQSCYKYLYSCASLIKAILLIKDAERSNDFAEDVIKRIFKAIDMGLLLGGFFRSELTSAANMLYEFVDTEYDYPISSFHELSTKLTEDLESVKGESVIVVNCPSLELFYRSYFITRLPVKLTGCINHWPALDKWQCVNYMFRMIGARLVPIEIGSAYTSADWTQKLMTGKMFMERFILAEGQQSQKGYLAQHQLFNQIPELLNDIREPEYCCLSECSDESNHAGSDINIWFGPCNTISPLHFDPKHNFLAQVVGFKRVILYDPKWTDCLYPHEDNLLFNTSQIDIGNPDYNFYSKFKDARAIKCVLCPGEMLYIPPGWWHYVRSLSVSTSVSFWWGI